MGDFHAAKNQLFALYQLMNVIAVSDSIHAGLLLSSLKILSIYLYTIKREKFQIFREVFEIFYFFTEAERFVGDGLARPAGQNNLSLVFCGIVGDVILVWAVFLGG
jgi:hypothetical protein